MSYEATTLADIAAMFDQKSAIATVASERANSKLQMALHAREANTWYEAAEILRQTTLTGSAPMRAALERVAALNPDAGEIGAGMLRTIVAEARAALPIK